MKTDADHLQHVQSLLDDPLHVVRAAARAGTRVIGYLGNDTPVAVIAACGALPVRLRGNAGASTARADRFMESAYTPESRAIGEAWLAGELDFIDSVVFPRTDDSAQRLYYYLCELQRRRLCGGPQPLLYDVANIARGTSIEHTRDSTRRLARTLGATDAQLVDAARRVARRASLSMAIKAQRADESPLPGSVAWRLERASDFDWRETFDSATSRWLERAPSLHGPRRILLAGDPPPDASLHQAIEDAGGSVVLELTESVPTPLSTQVPLIDALADEHHARLSPVLGMRENPQWVLDQARLVHAHAVVFWLIEQNEALPWEIARQMRSLEAARVATLLLARQPSPVASSSVQQVRGFVTTLEIKR
jgi:hypothetical protein